jgi:catechol 2,3-dioxygenase-like lactoylglutathione lyase family enzyme
MTRPTTPAILPSFIVSNVDQTIAFYRDKLGFETRFQQPDRGVWPTVPPSNGVLHYVAENSS